MVVMVLERVTPSLRGELTRWLIQPKTGIFVGHVSARVRDHLWDKVTASKRNGAALLVYHDTTEQGFSIKSAGRTSKIIEDFEGLLLPKTLKNSENGS
jgi:CRISPR-associated protein Cas2